MKGLNWETIITMTFVLWFIFWLVQMFFNLIGYPFYELGYALVASLIYEIINRKGDRI